MSLIKFFTKFFTKKEEQKPPQPRGHRLGVRIIMTTGRAYETYEAREEGDTETVLSAYRGLLKWYFLKNSPLHMLRTRTGYVTLRRDEIRRIHFYDGRL